MVEAPAATAVAKPFEPAELEMVAMVVLDELQVTSVVKFCWVPSV